MISWIEQNINESIPARYKEVLALLKSQGIGARSIQLMLPVKKNSALSFFKKPEVTYRVATLDPEIALLDESSIQLLNFRTVKQEQLDVILGLSQMIITPPDLVQRFLTYGVPVCMIPEEPVATLRAFSHQSFKKILFPVIRPENEEKTFEHLLEYCAKTKSSITLFHKPSLNRYGFDLGEPAFTASLELYMNHHRLSVLSSWVLKAHARGVNIQIHPDQVDQGFEKSLLSVVQKEFYDFISFDFSLLDSYFWSKLVISVSKKVKCPVWIPRDERGLLGAVQKPEEEKISTPLAA